MMEQPERLGPTASTESDFQLLALVQQGDERAMTRLFERYSSLIYSVALRILRDTAAAEDVMQEIFMQIWSKPTRFVATPGGSLGGWLAVISRNRSIDSLRNRRSTDSLEDVVLASPCNIAEGVVRDIELGRVRAAIAELPPEQRKALEMAFFQGLSHTEIAEETGDPLGTIKARIRTALQKLGKAFEA